MPSPLTIPSFPAAIAVVACALLPASLARADYGPGARPASATDTRLSDSPSLQPSLSGDGRYVAFTTSSPVLLGPPPDAAVAVYGRGMVRKDLISGAVEQVAPPELLRTDDGSQVPGSAPAVSASISDDGRYVLFATDAKLLGGDGNAVGDVYVRDMTRAVTDVDAYELVSALDATGRAPTYPTTGSAAGQLGASLSDDGRTAAFFTTGESNLPGSGAPGPATTPPLQVFVRYLDRLATRLVTRDGADPTLPGTPVPQLGAVSGVSAPQPVLSGSGQVVVWVDTNAGPQTPFLPGETPSRAHYLWRDLAAGPAAAARRITGASDLDDPACRRLTPYVASETATGPCYGPLAGGEAVDQGGFDTTPRPLAISDDGMTVLLRTVARLRPYAGEIDREATFTADMRAGVSRKQGTRAVLATSAVSDVTSSGLSGSGAHAVLNSRASAFPGLRPIGGFQTSALDTTNVFAVDLAAGTVERVTRAFDGTDYRGPSQPANPGVTTDPAPAALALDDTASTIAFDALDGNLFVGDVNDARDVQVVRRASTLPRATAPLPPAAGPPTASAAEPALAPLPARHPVIGYPTVSRSGVATIRVRVPAAGEVRALARGRSGRRSVRVASVRRRARRASTVVLRLAPSRAARRAASRRRTGLSVTVRVQYRPTSGAATKATRRYTLARRAAR